MTVDKPNEPSDTSDDSKLIDYITDILEGFRREITLSVHKQLSGVKATPPTDEPTPTDNSAVSELQQQLEAVKEQLKQERLTQQVSMLANKHGLHPDLLQLIVEKQGISEVNGQLLVGKEKPEQLEGFVTKYAATSEGSRLKTSAPQGTNLKDQSAPNPQNSVADALFSFATKGR